MSLISISILTGLNPPEIIDRALVEVIQMFLRLPLLLLLSKVQVMVAADAVTSQCLDLQRMTTLLIIQIMNSPEKLSSRQTINEMFFTQCARSR